MKLIAMLFTYTLLITSSAQAFDRDFQESVRAQVDDFYAASGEWTLLRIKRIDEVATDSVEFRLFSARTSIQNKETARTRSETCLVTFIAENSEFFGINCF